MTKAVASRVVVAEGNDDNGHCGSLRVLLQYAGSGDAGYCGWVMGFGATAPHARYQHGYTEHDGEPVGTRGCRASTMWRCRTFPRRNDGLKLNYAHR